MGLVTSNDNAFTGSDYDYEIVENGNTGLFLPPPMYATCPLILPAIPLGDDKIGRQPDGGLRLLNRKLRPPFLVWEVLDSQPFARMIEKISHYFTQSNGRIRFVVVIQLIRQCPPSGNKRKRRTGSFGDENEGRRRGRLPGNVGQGEPAHPLGRLVKGFYWVYKHGRNAAGKHVVLCPITQEVVPSCSPLMSPVRGN